jgi:outer membrane biosynthesis protein TonB
MARTSKRRASRRNFMGLVITVALHGGILLAVAAAHSQSEAPLIVPRDFVVAEMVKLGKPRDKFWLPRLTQPPRPTAPPDALKLAEDPNAKPAPKDAPRPEDPAVSKDLRRALERARKLEALAVPEEDEGSATGSRLGASNQAVGDQYLAQVLGLLRENYNLPAGIAPEQISKPPIIGLKIAADGTLSGIRLLEHSNNSFVDDACVNAAQLTRRVPPPPAGWSRINREVGFRCQK